MFAICHYRSITTVIRVAKFRPISVENSYLVGHTG